jgi:hypothetical protein
MAKQAEERAKEAARREARKLTLEKYQKIKVAVHGSGSGEVAVAELLGRKGDCVASYRAPDHCRDEEYIWEEDGRAIAVTFRRTMEIDPGTGRMCEGTAIRKSKRGF